MHNFGKWEFTQPKNQMHVIRHHHDCCKIDYPLLIQPTRAVQYGMRRIRIAEKMDSIATAACQ